MVGGFARTFMLHDGLFEHADLSVETAEAPLELIFFELAHLVALDFGEFGGLDPQLPYAEAADVLAGLPRDRVQVSLRLPKLRLV